MDLEKKQKFGLIRKNKWVFILGITGLIIIILISKAKGVPMSDEQEEITRQIEVIKLADLSSDGGQVPVVGTLRATEQIDLRPQMPGQVSAVRVNLNQQVYRGQVLVELAHRDLNASVAQASANLQSAQAQLEKLKNGARPEDIIIAQQNLQAAQQQLQDMKNGGRPEEVSQANNAVKTAQQALNDANTNYVLTEQQNQLNLESTLDNAGFAISGAKITVESILNKDLDSIYNRYDSDNFLPVTEDFTLTTRANSARDQAGSAVEQWPDPGNSHDRDTVENEIEQSLTVLKTVKEFLNVTNSALNNAISVPAFTGTNITTAKTVVNTSLTSVQNLIDGLTASGQSIDQLMITNQQSLDKARAAIENAAIALDNAKEQLQIVTSGASRDQIGVQESIVEQAKQQLLIAENGARPEDLKVQEAFVSQARAALALAAANRDKALVTAPISGTVTYIPVEIGDMASSSTIVVSLANKNALEVKTYVNENERLFINVGNEVQINDEYSGQILEIAPALDPVNKKIKVVVAVDAQDTALTLGETVKLKLQKNPAESTLIRLPLTAVKLNDEKAQVFAVNDEDRVYVIDVSVGEVSGGYITIRGDLDQNLVLIKDARGLKENQLVKVIE